MCKWVCVMLGVMSMCGLGYSASEIIVSAGRGVYCLDSNGNLKWSFPHTNIGVEQSSPAIGDIDNNGRAEVLVGADKLYCLSDSGNLKWSYPGFFYDCSPAIANIDTSGDAEVIIATRDTLYCFNSDGTIKWTYGITGGFSSWTGPVVTVANIDVAGTPEVFAATPARVYCMNSNGTLKWSYQMNENWFAGIGVTDLNLDGSPEIVVTNCSEGRIYCLRADGSAKWSYNVSTGVSQPAIADINSDNKPEIVAFFESSKQMTAFQENTAGTGLDTVWSAPCSSTSFPFPVICDIDGDGDKDVMLVSEGAGGCPTCLWILNGLDGKHPDNSGAQAYRNFDFSSSTARERGVAVADIDDDGRVEIVGIHHTIWPSGVAVLECDSFWAGGRNLFTSELYHITDINDDLTIPKIEPNNWQSHNTWVTQLTTGGSGFGNPTIKWIYRDTTWGSFWSSIAIAPIYNPIGTEEKESHREPRVGILYNISGTIIRFSVSKSEEVSFRIFDLAGREQKTVNMGIMAEGIHELPLNMANFENGVYFVQANIGDRIFNCKAVVIK